MHVMYTPAEMRKIYDRYKPLKGLPTCSAANDVHEAWHASDPK